jgi:AI-2 transport protein TqsA
VAAVSESRIRTVCLMILAAFAVTVSLMYMRSVLVPFVISVFLYFLMSPFVNTIQVKLKLPRAISVLLAVLAGLLFVSAILLIVFLSLRDFIEGASVYEQKLIAFAAQAEVLAQKNGFELKNLSMQQIVKGLPITNIAKGLSGGVLGFVGNATLVVIFVMFLIGGQNPKKARSGLKAEIDNRVKKYVIVKIITSVSTAIIVGTVLGFAGVDLAFMFAVFTFLLNFIPSVGSIIAVLLPLPVILLQFGFGGVFIVVLVLTALTQFTIGNVVEPRMAGESLGLHPVTILIALVFWGIIWGIPGMFLAAPITAIIKIILEKLEPTKGFAQLMAGES